MVVLYHQNVNNCDIIYIISMKGVNNMISKDNIRMSLVIPKELKKELQQIAKSENRSLNNLIITILKNYMNNK